MKDSKGFPFRSFSGGVPKDNVGPAAVAGERTLGLLFLDVATMRVPVAVKL